jgi:hypothetical protein
VFTEDRVLISAPQEFDPGLPVFRGWAPAIESVAAFYGVGDHFYPAELYGAPACPAQVRHGPSEMCGCQAVGDPNTQGHGLTGLV